MILRCCAALAALSLLIGCGGEPPLPGRVVRVADGERIVGLDPALAADVRSQRLVSAFFDTLLAYRYPQLPYELVPSMAAGMPEVLDGGKTYRFTLRDDLWFHPDPCFDGMPEEVRRVDAAAAVFSLLRLGDGRLGSAAYSLYRGKIEGLDAFHAATAGAEAGDFSLYDAGIPGLKVLDERRFEIRLTAPDPRFLYLLAIPCSGIVSRRAAEYYGDRISEHPVGSGPFILERWQREYMITMNRNPDFRLEYYPQAARPEDRARPLPLADRIECVSTRQPQASWLLFLQGELDLAVLSRDNADIVVTGEGISPALAARGIGLVRIPSLEVQYIGFSFTEPRLRDNPALRRAMALGYDIPRLIEYANYQMEPAAGPLPPGVPGYDPALTDSRGGYDLEQARQEMIRAGYPGGVDPATGEALALTLDMNGNSALHRQLGNLFAADMARLGIAVTVVLNNSPRFYQKLAAGQVQLFRLSWKGDYPDAENFLQLFYSGNIGGANRVGYADAEYDALFERYLTTPPGEESDRLLRRMVAQLLDRQPWIFESVPVNFQLKHGWLDNVEPHDFAYGAWKYLSVDPEKRETARKGFTPLRLDLLQ